MMILGNAPKLIQEDTGSIGRSVHSQVARQLVDIEILYLLNFGAKSGYELRKSLSKSFGIKISYGTLYPHLHALERSDLIIGTWSQKEDSSSQTSLKKRVYDLTSRGTIVLKESIEKLGSISLTMQFLLNKVDLGKPNESLSLEKERTLELIQSVLSTHDYQFERNIVDRGISGMDHPLELLARGKAGTKLIVRITEDGEKFSLDDALKMLVITNDVQAQAMVLACPPLRKDVSELCKFYHIQLFESDNWQSVLSCFEASLAK